jgi:hypothetical protein
MQTLSAIGQASAILHNYQPQQPTAIFHISTIADGHIAQQKKKQKNQQTQQAKTSNISTSVKTIMKSGSSTHIYYQGWQVNHISTIAVKQYEGQQFVFINPSSFLLYFKKTQIN